MRLNKYLLSDSTYKNTELLMEILLANSKFSAHRLDEMGVPASLFNYMRDAGAKMGINVKRSDSIFTYIAKVEGSIVDLFTYATLYFFATDKNQRRELYNDMKSLITSIDKRELAAFLVQLDKSTMGLSSFIRNTLQSLFGIEIATYNKVLPELDWILKEIPKIRSALERMKADAQSFVALDRFELVVKNKLTNEEDGGGIVTGDVATYDKRLTGMTRRKKRKRIHTETLL